MIVSTISQHNVAPLFSSKFRKCSHFASLDMRNQNNFVASAGFRNSVPHLTSQYCYSCANLRLKTRNFPNGPRRILLHPRASASNASVSPSDPSEGKKPGRRRKNLNASVSPSVFSDGKQPGRRRDNFKKSKDLKSSQYNSIGEESKFTHNNQVSGGHAASNGKVLSNGQETEPESILDEESNTEESAYVIYEPKKEEVLDDYEQAKKYGEPHPFMPPNTKKKESLPRERLWWNRREPPETVWSRWNRRVPTSDWVMAKAMAETGQIKLFGENPTVTEATLALARKKALKEERLKAEEDRMAEIGPVAYYKEWVKGWHRDTSREAVRKHYEETGETAHQQLINMLQCQTEREYRIMMGRDVRIQRDPLVMRMRPELKIEAFGGDPVFPVVNYEQAPDHVTDFRGPFYHEPTRSVVEIMKAKGICITEEELRRMQETEKDDFKPREKFRMVEAVDIGEEEEIEEGDGDEDEDEADPSPSDDDESDYDAYSNDDTEGEDDIDDAEF
eukprot:TRINITY_DN2351_c0_g1_i3.p1 TRINITY_DN2351_c0_g1~~TRINITY_DN2351_c0_g1_i3.p1  ORF type:complete len:504 (+),score=108.78 TRINITY_DN2351_c0_g1_i3:292-1803(+)